jgi:hypothetical protein
VERRDAAKAKFTKSSHTIFSPTKRTVLFAGTVCYSVFLNQSYVFRSLMGSSSGMTGLLYKIL